MTDTKVTLESPAREQITSASTPQWITRVIRCRACRELVRESGRRQVSDDETVVDFECDYCCHHETRHYFENSLGL